MSSKIALVIRATGAQGKNVTKHLLESGWKVHALVRDPSESRALDLKDLGAELHEGSLGDPSSLEFAIQGCTAVFLNQMPSFVDATQEPREASALLDVAKKAGVKHVVHSTSLGLNKSKEQHEAEGAGAHPALIGKTRVEEAVRDSGLTWTILRPGYFMVNFMPPLSGFMFTELPEGKVVTMFKPDTVLPLVDPNDIGAFVAAALEDPQKYGGKTISPVSELLSWEKIVQELSNWSGKKIEMVSRTPENMEQNALKVFGERETMGLSDLVNMDEVKSWGVPLTSFRTFLQTQDPSAVSVDLSSALKDLTEGKKI